MPFTADIDSLRNALATTVTSGTGLRVLPDAYGQVSPPVGVVLPGDPLIIFGATMDGAVTVNLRLIIIISSAAPDEKVQRALDAYLGIGHGAGPNSIPEALQMDPTLGGAVHFAIPVSVSNYGRITYAGEEYFGARVNIQIGSI